MRRREFIAGLGAAAWPLAAGAQQRVLPVIGLLSGFAAASPLVANFHRGLKEVDFGRGTMSLSITSSPAGLPTTSPASPASPSLSN